MEGLTQVNKLIGENITNIIKTPSRSIYKRLKTWNYQTVRKIFTKNLINKGYSLTIDGCYIKARQNNETITFYFAAHSPQNTNYCLPTVLKNKVDYFVFYNNKTDVIYTVGYGIVREYCKNIKNAYVFYNNYKTPKMFIPDEWAHKQQINTMLMY